MIELNKIVNDAILPTMNLDLDYNPERLLYVLYTSGSTGKPKGVMIKSHAFMNLLEWYTTEFKINESDHMLLIAPVSFDLAQKNLYSTLIKGGKLCLFTPGLYDYHQMSELIAREAITIINCTPSAFYPLLEFNQEDGYHKLKSLRYVFLGGEPINLATIKPWIDAPLCQCEVVNTYGPTECTDIAAAYRIERSDYQQSQNVPIGKPIYNVQLYVLDRNYNLQPEGIPGELCIGGTGLGLGYYNDPQLTVERYLERPKIAACRLYRTGDLVRWLPDGELEFLGRIDHQVKIRGFRIELGEIETELKKADLVHEAVVIVREDLNCQKYLCAYLVADSQINITNLRQFLKKRLPDYMIPTYFTQLDQLPLTPNGKINRQALPEPTILLDQSQTYMAPGSQVEENLLLAWQQVLHKERISIHDNFFDLGGNSLLLIQLHAKIEKLYPGVAQITDLFSYPTVSKMAGFIENRAKKGEAFYLAGIKLPEDFYSDKASTKVSSAFRFQLGEETLAVLKIIAATEKVRLISILIAMYGYLFNHVSGISEITIQTLVTQKNRVFPQTLNLNSIANFSKLFKEVEVGIHTEKENGFQLGIDQRDLGKSPEDVVVLVYRNELLTETTGLQDIFDITMGVSLSDQSLNLICEYNAQKLTKESVKELVQQFNEILELLVEKYQTRVDNVG